MPTCLLQNVKVQAEFRGDLDGDRSIDIENGLELNFDKGLK